MILQCDAMQRLQLIVDIADITLVIIIIICHVNLSDLSIESQSKKTFYVHFGICHSSAYLFS